MPNINEIELPKAKIISDLEAVSVKADIKQKTKGEGDDKYSYFYLVVNEEEYRVPNSVITQVQALVEKQEIKTYKVIRTGTTKTDTNYSIQVLE